MWRETPLTRALSLRFPIIQAPMAGGPTSPALVAAVSEAGGLGVYGAGYAGGPETRAVVRQLRALTAKPFGMNLFVPGDARATPAQVAQASALLERYREELGLAEEVAAAPSGQTYMDQVAVLLEERIPVVTFTFGVPDVEVVRALQAQGAIVMGTATTVREGLALAGVGVDYVVGQGVEAGGHRGTFSEHGDAQVGTFALIPQLTDALDVPVIAAGGIMEARGIAAAFALGAAGVQMGTAFMRCPEAGTHALHREALAASSDESTALTRTFTGKPVRAIVNRFVREMRAYEEGLPAYPIQHALTQPIRRKAAELGRVDLMGMWAGQASHLARPVPAAELMAIWASGVDATYARLGKPHG